MNTSMKNALEWYQEQAEAAARHSIQVNTEALMAIVQALALDEGSRAKTALTANADLLTERDNLASIVATGIDDVAGAALDDAEETINDLRAQIDALTAVPANAEPVALVDRIEDLIAEFGEKSLPMIGEAIGRWRQAAPASAEPVAWQNIETAPRDRTPVLLGYEGWLHPIVGYFSLNLGWVEHGTRDTKAKMATKWMPLPENPLTIDN
jgi:hypothetical protein